MNELTRQPKLLKDYAAPDYLIEEVELDVRLAPACGPRRRQAPAPTESQSGDRRQASRARRRGSCARERGARRQGALAVGLRAQGGLADHPARPGAALHARARHASATPRPTLRSPGFIFRAVPIAPNASRKASAASPFFLDRPDVLAVYTVRIEADRAVAPVLLSNGNPVAQGDIPGTGRHFAVWHDPFPKPSYLFALVGGNLACVPDSFVTASGRKVDSRHLCRARQGGPLRLGDGVAEARHALGRGALRPRIRSRRVQHRRRQRLQHGGDGEQGPQHLQRQARARPPRHRERRRLRLDRRRDRARIFPQLERQTASPAATGSSSA